MPVFDHLTDQKAVLLVTFRQDGRPVGTPVNVVVKDGRAYFRTSGTSWKAKRIGRNPEVKVAPSTPRGEPAGPSIGCHVRMLSRAEIPAVRRLLIRKHPVRQGLVVPVRHRLGRSRSVYYELVDLLP